jgi:hypothetical protein
MKSDIIKGEGEINYGEALAQVEKVTNYCGLNHRDSLTVRLLAEEMISMTTHILKYSEGAFWIIEENKTFELHISAKAILSEEQKKEFVSASTKKENIAYKGILGKIKNVFENYLIDNDGIGASYVDFNYGSVGMYNPSVDYFSQSWSMNDFSQSADDDEQKEAWDGLERSLLAMMSDDIIVGAKNNMVEMIVKKTF